MKKIEQAKAIDLEYFLENDLPIFETQFSPVHNMTTLDLKGIGRVKKLFFGVQDADNAIVAFFVPGYEAFILVKHSLNGVLSLYSNDSLFARFVLFKFFVPNYLSKIYYKDMIYSDGWLESKEERREVRADFKELVGQSFD